MLGCSPLSWLSWGQSWKLGFAGGSGGIDEIVMEEVGELRESTVDWRLETGEMGTMRVIKTMICDDDDVDDDDVDGVVTGSIYRISVLSPFPPIPDSLV